MADAEISGRRSWQPGIGQILTAPLLLDLLMVCGVLGAALVASQKDKHVVKQAEQDESESLRDLVK